MSEVIVKVTQAGMAADRFYGPFATLHDAEEWMGEQPAGVRFSIILLRSPNLKRSYNDFFNPSLDDPELDGGRGDIVYHV
jgi:hypothetical protein